MFLAARDLGFPNPPAFRLSSGVNFTRGNHPRQRTIRASRAYLTATHAPSPLAQRSRRGERRIGQSQSYITRHYLFLRFSAASRGRPSELPSTARTTALTSANPAKTLLATALPRRLSREFDPPPPTPFSNHSFHEYTSTHHTCVYVCVFEHQ